MAEFIMRNGVPIPIRSNENKGRGAPPPKKKKEDTNTPSMPVDNTGNPAAPSLKDLWDAAFKADRQAQGLEYLPPAFGPQDIDPLLRANSPRIPPNTYIPPGHDMSGGSSGGSNLANIPTLLRDLNDQAGKRAGLLEEIRGMVGNKPNNLALQIEQILNKPDIPGQWISPYSQDFLNQLGSRLNEAGVQTSQLYDEAGRLINENYDRTANQLKTAESPFMEQLAAGLQRLGGNMADSRTAQEYQANNALLSQAADLNRSNDLNFGEKLKASNQAAFEQLGLMAREGLLTPKQYVPPRSGLSPSDEFKVEFLKKQLYDQLDASTTLDTERKLREQASEEALQLNPSVPPAISRIDDPRLRDAASSAYDSAGGDILKVLENLSNYEYPSVPPARMGQMPADTPLSGILRYQTRARESGEDAAKVREQMALNQQLIELFRALSPTWGGQTTQRTVSNSSIRER